MEVGIDVSAWQGEMDWNQARQAGVRFAMIKACEGTAMDRQFLANWQGACKAGLPCGAYAYFRYDVPARDQARFFCQCLAQAGESGVPGLPPALDLEMPLPPSDLSARVREWLDIVEDALAVRPMLYTSSGFWNAHLRTNTWAGQYPLWIASYGTAAPLVPLPWAPFTWTMWQFNPKGDGEYYGAGSKSIDLNVRPGQDPSGGLHVV